VGVAAEDFEAVFAAGELPGEVGGDVVELGGEGGEIGAGRARRVLKASVWARRPIMRSSLAATAGSSGAGRARRGA
jgi:hypothetical protein